MNFNVKNGVVSALSEGNLCEKNEEPSFKGHLERGLFHLEKEISVVKISVLDLNSILASTISLGIQISAFFDLFLFFATIQSQLPVIYR